jgi:amino acid transporter
MPDAGIAILAGWLLLLILVASTIGTCHAIGQNTTSGNTTSTATPPAADSSSDGDKTVTWIIWGVSAGILLLFVGLCYYSLQSTPKRHTPAPQKRVYSHV